MNTYKQIFQLLSINLLVNIIVSYAHRTFIVFWNQTTFK